MTDLADVAQREKKTRTTVVPSRQEIEHSLALALEQGTAAVGQQVRLTLALAQLGGMESGNTVRVVPPLSPAHARLAAMVGAASNLSTAQLKGLLRDIRAIPDMATRLELTTQIALYLPPEGYQPLLHLVWENAFHVEDPASRSSILFHMVPLLSLLHDEPSAPPALLEVVAIAQAITSSEAHIRSLTTLAPHLPHTMRVRLLHRVLDDIDRLNNDASRRNAISALVGQMPAEIEARVLRSAESIQTPGERARALTSLARSMPPLLQPRLRANALDAIRAITGEEERAAALISFAPHLEFASESEEFPILLEQALSIAVGLTRRSIRAHALVALAPHLPLTLQGEALAAVHSLSSERERAMMLAELAPTLPPEMVVASLAVAHTMREQDSRVHALTYLARFAPESARAQTLLDALAAAANLPHQYERVTALVALIDALPPPLQDRALANALETTLQISKESARARALGLIGPYLRGDLLLRALDVAITLQDPQQRMSAITGLAPHIEGERRGQALAQLLATVKQIPFEYKRARALISIAPILTQELVQESLLLAHEINDPFDRVSVFVTLVQNLPPEQRPTLIGKAWTLVHAIEDGYDRASALAALAPYLPPAAHADVVHAAGMAIGSIMDEYDQASAIGILAPLMALSGTGPAMQLPDSYTAIEEGVRAALQVSGQTERVRLLKTGVALWVSIADHERSYRLWSGVLQSMAHFPLADSLLVLSEMFPVIRALAGDEGVAEVALILSAGR